MVKLQKDSNGRYHLTLPKKFVDGYDWKKGDEFQYRILSEESLKLEKK